MLILGVHSGHHDASACLYEDYRMLAAVAQERMTRRKLDGGRVPVESIDECLAATGHARRDVDAIMLSRGSFPSRYYTHLGLGREIERWMRDRAGRSKHKTMERELARAGTTDGHAIFDSRQFLADHGFGAQTTVGFYNHHLAHALPTLFHTGWDDALMYTSDGGGDNVQYSHRIFRDGEITTLDGDDECLLQPTRIDSLGLAYGYATQALGWKINQHEGKLTGLAATGEPTLYPALAQHYSVDDAGRIMSDFESYPALRRFIFELADGVAREDVAASLQKLLEEFTIEAVRRILDRNEVGNLGLAGGVFANVLLNQRLAEELPVSEIFIYPAMSDQGLPAGGVLHFLMQRDGLNAWLANRVDLKTLYYGRDYTHAIDDHMAAMHGVEIAPETVAETVAPAAARLIADGAVIALYTGAMEYGPRALGARSILASPADARINNTLNRRLARSEFMPFAPVVRSDDADELFHVGPGMRYAMRFMTITCRVREAWRARIPAVVHVDGTARPQIIEREPNALYFDILTEFKSLTGLPALINTSFNVHEQPIINTPEECAAALLDRRVDYVATSRAIYQCRQ